MSPNRTPLSDQYANQETNYVINVNRPDRLLSFGAVTFSVGSRVRGFTATDDLWK